MVSQADPVEIQARRTDIFERKDNKVRLLLHPGQTRTWDSLARFPFMLSGSQGGKTSFGPHWLKREIDRCGPGDYLAVTATYPLLNLKMLPEFLKVFRDLYNLGVYRDSDKVFEYHYDKTDPLAQKTRVIFASAANPESIESATANAAWLDELGQKQFRLGSWEAINRRLNIAFGLPYINGAPQGRGLITSTPYGVGWQKQEIYDRWEEDMIAGRESDFDIIQFDSTMNPAFSQKAFESARRVLPKWKFNLFYRGLYDRPAGLVYDAFDRDLRKPRAFNKPPSDWMCYVGHDFGPQNTAAIWFAQHPTTGDLFAYREYLKGGLSSAGHAQNIIDLSQGENIMRRVGGAAVNEDGYRDAYTAAGWPIIAPTLRGVAAGIDRVYALFKSHKLFIFDDLRETIDDLETYSYKLDSKYLPTEEIEDKQNFHLMDAMRYGLQDMRPVSTSDAESTPVGPIAGSPRQ